MKDSERINELEEKVKLLEVRIEFLKTKVREHTHIQYVPYPYPQPYPVYPNPYPPYDMYYPRITYVTNNYTDAVNMNNGYTSGRLSLEGIAGL